MMKLDEKLIGWKFTVNDPNIDKERVYACVGYGSSGTFVIIGAYSDAVKNETTLKTFKLTEVKFKGML